MADAGGSGREEQIEARAPRAMGMARNKQLQEAKGSGGVDGVADDRAGPWRLGWRILAVGGDETRRGRRSMERRRGGNR